MRYKEVTVDLFKGVLLGFAAYFVSSMLSKFTGVNQWLYVIWLSGGIVAYNLTKNIDDKEERTPVLIAIAKVTGISTCVALFIQYLGSNIDKWL